jgi:hypothetical protein
MLQQTKWRTAKEEAKQILAERASLRGMMSYTELAEKITSWNFSPRDPQLFKLLDDVSREENEDGRGLLSCIVVHKVGDMEPGTGFYDLAVQLGRSGDKLGLWVNELHKVHAVWEREKLRKGL